MGLNRIDCLEELMPHRSKMKWIEFIEFGEEKGQGNTTITATEDSLFIIEGELASSAVIEMMAQTFGYVKGAEAKEDGLIGFKLKTDGTRGDSLNLPQVKNFEPLIEGSTHQRGGYSPIQMNGQEVYKFAVREVPLILEELLAVHGIKSNELDWLLMHQANQRILDAVAERFQIPHEKVLSNLSNYGNTSAATIPLMLDEAVRDGRVRSGHLIASSGFGAGLSWGAALLRWQGPV